MSEGLESCMTCADCGKQEAKVLCVTDDKLRCWDCWMKWREGQAERERKLLASLLGVRADG